MTFFFILGFLFFAPSALAVTVTISNVPATISDQSFSFNVSLNCSGCGPSYLRANFFPSGTFNYFGYTFNDNSFVNSSTCTDYLPVTVDASGNWNGTMQAKIDPTSSYYTGSGSYSFKVRRYTPSCSSSYTWSNEVTTTITTSSPSSPSPSPSNPTSSSTPSSSFSISGVPSEISSDQSFSVPVIINLPDYLSTKFYLKGAFKKTDSQNYFGQTKVGGVWVGNSKSYTDQYQITIDSSGNWSGTLEVKPDILDSGYDGAGTYVFKVGKYSSAGSLTWSNEVNIQITAKEVTSGVLDSTLPSNPPSSKTTKSKTQGLPDEIYGLENYRKQSTIAGIVQEATPEVAVQNEKFKNPFLIIGGTLILLGISSTCFILFKRWKNT